MLRYQRANDDKDADKVKVAKDDFGCHQAEDYFVTNIHTAKIRLLFFRIFLYYVNLIQVC
jgi:hypothetical protein